jgi:hypothetical protein
VKLQTKVIANSSIVNATSNANSNTSSNATIANVTFASVNIENSEATSLTDTTKSVSALGTQYDDGTTDI